MGRKFVEERLREILIGIGKSRKRIKVLDAEMRALCIKLKSAHRKAEKRALKHDISEKTSQIDAYRITIKADRARARLFIRELRKMKRQ